MLFHDDPASLFAIYQGVKGTQASKQWYSMLFFGTAGPLLLGIERAKVPVVEVPIALAQLSASTFDAKTGKVTLELLGRKDGSASVRLRLPGHAWNEVKITLKKNLKSIVTLTP